jgi:hypothetical protein
VIFVTCNPVHNCCGPAATFRLLPSSYVGHEAEAGLLRFEDVESGRKGFFATYDTSQGGGSPRHSLGATLEESSGEFRLAQSAFVILRDFRLRQNLTGFTQELVGVDVTAFTTKDGDVLPRRSLVSDYTAARGSSGTTRTARASRR